MPDEEIYSLEWCRCRPVPDIHLARMVRNRELGSRKSGTHYFSGAREFYQCIHPSQSVSGIDRKNLIIKRFSPDGNSLICFSPDGHDLHIRDYIGFTNAYNKQHATMFEDVFPERFMVNLVIEEEGAVLNEEFIFFTEDSRYLLVAVEYPTSESVLTWNDIYQNSESNPPVSFQRLINYIIYSIDLRNGDICDKYFLNADRLWISYGVNLVGHLLAILSYQHQTLHFLHIDENTGFFNVLGRVGRYLLADDEDLVLAAEKSGNSLAADVVLSGVKQRILSYLYHHCSDSSERYNFLNYFSQFRSLRMWQMQLITPAIVLIRFVHEETFIATLGTGNYPLLLVLMEWQTGIILGVYDRYSTDFLKLLQNCQEEFRYPHVYNNRFPCTIQHCHAALMIYNRMKDALTNTSGGSDKETRRRIICGVPYSFTSVPVETPYLDPSMFRFDDYLTAMVERAKLSDNEAINLRFFSRITNLPLFEMHLNEGRAVQLLFHPTDPFAISMDRTSESQTITFHLPPYVTPDDPC
ncbi:unnamed protein product [Thelazia callipaeda]|uniref:DET1 homolog n=1 Tax=Thelazia callipaeda TaxID=103827 RepID=A0A0N5CPF2_THECL|nr:unnamed protein product [Thelazia callipaeda]